ncbi:YidC family membrane integrase SpoIIIJ [Caldibacillus lycopersici]|uniref:Membrane protein insertase YidC n=1 Tax=Perspicuibacillus lycopersici TaxID=1325689 RepID=A0AAE3IV70_9BACI|nr:YidC family membrane integrase SpoIIIJ [Perspicuibacillus lycopersici]MCU9613484.1 YidC family membrane integrase SpoIIIJ [Perspicuibacillus lycopersici]
MKKKVLLLISLLLIVTFLAGCSEINQPVTSESEGIWNEIFVYPLSWLIIKIANIFHGNWGYGLAIIIVTILIRTAILPLMVKQLKSSKRMQLIQPELQKLKQKYASKDAVTQQKFQQEQIALMQKYDINPLTGCLPILIQMPILLGFYHAIMRTEELKGNSFLWFELADKDPYFILPIIAGITTFLQQKFMTKGQPANPQLAIMLWVMPVMIVFVASMTPAALPLYWIVGNIYSIVQTFFIKTPEIAELEQTSTATSKRSGGKKK